MLRFEEQVPEEKATTEQVERLIDCDMSCM